MKKIAVLSLLPIMLMFSGVALADDPPAEPTPAADAKPADEAKPADAAKSDDPVDVADKTIEDGIKPIDEDPAAQVNAIIAAFKEGRWAAAIGLLVMFLVWVLRRFIWKLIPKNVLPWLTLALGCVVTVSTELIIGLEWWKALIDGFITGACAMGLWSTIFKHFMAPKEEKPDPA
jgi:hypothetical protein